MAVQPSTGSQASGAQSDTFDGSFLGGASFVRNDAVTRLYLTDDWREYRLSEIPEEFYSKTVHRILPLCGIGGVRTYNFHDTVLTLNKDLRLRLDRTDCDALSRLLTELSTSGRFRNDIYLDRGVGENSAVHSCHSTILMNEMFRRAGFLDLDRQTEDVTRLRVMGTLGCVIHDMGEMLGEVTSLAERAASGAADDIGNSIERRIFESAVRLAYASVQKDDAPLFSESIHALRAACKVGTAASQSYEEIDKILSQYSPGELSPDFEWRVQRILRIFDIVEGKDADSITQEEKFCGYLVKAVEHIQGTRHFTRFADHTYPKDGSYNLPGWCRERITRFKTPVFPTRVFVTADSDPLVESAAGAEAGAAGSATRRTVSTFLMSSTRMRRNVLYNEEGLGEMFHAAEGSPLLMALARTARDASYETTIEWLSRSNLVFDREASSELPRLRELQEEVWYGREGEGEGRVELANREIEAVLRQIEEVLIGERAALLKKYGVLKSNLYKEGIEALGDVADARLLSRCRHKLLPVETSMRLMSLYETAIRRDYIPASDTPLALLDELPRELENFERIDWKNYV